MPKLGTKGESNMGFNMLKSMGNYGQSADLEITMLNINDLVSLTDNFYAVENPRMDEQNQDLKDSIEMFGVKQPILVVPSEVHEGKYEIIAGHRRVYACHMLCADGEDKFSEIPCIIDEDNGKLVEKLKMIMTNSTVRILSDWEKVEQVRQLKLLLLEYKEAGHQLPGRLREIIADTLKMSKSAVGRMEQIDKSLTPELKEEFKDGNISMSTATELSSMSAADQKAVYEKTDGKPKLKDATAKKESHQAVTTPKKTQDDENTMHQRSIEDIENNIYAVKSTMNMLECEIGRIADLKSFDEEQGNLDGAAKRAAHIEYLGELLERVQQDLSDLEN